MTPYRYYPPFWDNSYFFRGPRPKEAADPFRSLLKRLVRPIQPPQPHVIISYSQSLSARRTVSTNVLSVPMTAFEPAKFA
jgi:hypothetical protein